MRTVIAMASLIAIAVIGAIVAILAMLAITRESVIYGMTQIIAALN